MSSQHIDFKWSNITFGWTPITASGSLTGIILDYVNTPAQITGVVTLVAVSAFRDVALEIARSRRGKAK